MSVVPPLLLGCWHLQSADRALEMSEPVELEFRPDGRLVYSIDSGGKWQIMRLTFQVDGSDLVTNQPSAPKRERTGFSIGKDGRLVLDYGGRKATFVRGLKRAPESEAYDGWVIFKLVAWYAFNTVLSLLTSALTITGHGETRNAWLVLAIMGGSTLVCGILSIAYMVEREPALALKCARSAVCVGWLLLIAAALLEAMFSYAR